MQMALPVIMLLMIIAALGGLLMTAPEPGQPLDMLTTSGVHNGFPDQPSAPPPRTP